MLPSSLDRPPGGIIATALSRHRLLKAGRPLLDTGTAYTVSSGESANKYDHVPFSDRHDAKPSLASHYPHPATSAVYSTFVENSPRLGSGMVAEALRNNFSSDNGAPNGFLPGGKGTEQSAILGAVWRGQASSPPLTSPSSKFLLPSDHAAVQKAEHLLSLSTHTRSQLKRSSQKEDYAVGSDQLSPSATPRKIPKQSNEQKPKAGRTNIPGDGLSLSAIDHKKQHVLSPDVRTESRHGHPPRHEVVSRKEKHTSSHISHGERNITSRQAHRKPSIPSAIGSRASSAASQDSSHSKAERISPSRVFPTQRRDTLPVFETRRESKRTHGVLTERYHLDEISPEDRTSYKHHLPSVESTSTAEKDAAFRRTSLRSSSGQRPSTRRGSDRSQSHSLSTRREPFVDADYRQHMPDRTTSGAHRQPRATDAEADPVHTGRSTSRIRPRHDTIPEYPLPSSRSSLRSRRGRVGETNLGNGSPSNTSRDLGLKVSSIQGSPGSSENECLNRSNLRSSQEHTLRTHRAVDHPSGEHERIPKKVGQVSTKESTSGEVEAVSAHCGLKSQGAISSASHEASASDVQRIPSFSGTNRRPSAPDDHSEENSSHQHPSLNSGPPNPSNVSRLDNPSTLNLSVQERLPSPAEEDLQSNEHHQKPTRIGSDDARDALSPGRMSERISEAKGRMPRSGDAGNIGHPLELRLQIEADNTNETRDQEAAETSKSSFHSRTAEIARRGLDSLPQVNARDVKTGPSLSDVIPVQREEVELTDSSKKTSAQTLDATHKERPSSPIVDNGITSISTRNKSVEDMNVASRISSTRPTILRSVDSMDDASELRSGILGRLLHEMRGSTDVLEGGKAKDNGKQSPTVAETKPLFRKETHTDKEDHESGIKKGTHLASASTSDAISSPQEQRSVSNIIGETTMPSDKIASNTFVKENVDEGKRLGVIGKLPKSSIAERVTNRITNVDSDDKPTSGTETALGEPTSSIQLSGRNKTAIADEKRDGILGRLLQKENLLSGKQAIERIDDEPRYGIIGRLLDRGTIDDDAMVNIFNKPVIADKTQPLYESPRSGMLAKMLERNKTRRSSALLSNLSEMETERERSTNISPRDGMLGMMLAGNDDLAPNRLGRRGSRRGFFGSQIAEAEDALPEYSRRHDLFASRSFPSCESESPIGSERDSKLSNDERLLATDPSTKVRF
uniref:Serine/arginine repetitive matrix protein 2 n=1 Tax=Ascaris lumbricoides TaxID=6252 RepID=A0A0M3ILT1_ASCLU